MNKTNFSSREEVIQLGILVLKENIHKKEF
jgi:hypothetical protein